MFNLINNDCIKLTDLDRDSGGCQGEIYFHGSELYSGSIQNGLPNGDGSLQLADKSIYDGTFDNKSIVQGKFIHFTGMLFEGKFKRDKFYTGKIYFVDGDTLEGQWGIKRNKWILKTGTLFDEENNKIFEFDTNEDVIYKSKLKTLESMNKDEGFCITFDYYYDQGSQPLLELKITADCKTTYKLKQEQQILCITNSYKNIPYQRTQKYKNDILIDQNYKISLGLQIQMEKLFGEDTWKLNFLSLKNIYARGQFEFSKNYLQFQGELLNIGKDKNQINIQKNTFGNLQIKFQNVLYNSLDQFYKHISDKYKHVQLIQQEKCRKGSEINKQAFGQIVKDLNTEKEQCRIF